MIADVLYFVAFGQLSCGKNYSLEREVRDTILGMDIERIGIRYYSTQLDMVRQNLTIKNVEE